MAYADQQMSGNKIIAIIIVALIHVALGYALDHRPCLFGGQEGWSNA